MAASISVPTGRAAPLNVRHAKGTAPELGYGWLIVLNLAYFLGLELLLVPLAALYFGAKVPRTRYGTQFITVCLCLCASLTLSSLLGTARGGEITRFLSSAYSVYIVLFGCLAAKFIADWCIYRGRKFGLSSKESILVYFGLACRLLIFLFCSVLVIGVVYYFITRNGDLRFPTLLASFGRTDIEVLGYLSETRIYRADWGFGGFAAPRFIYLARWDTAGAVLVVIAGTFASLYSYKKIGARSFWLIEFIVMILVLSTLTRTIIAAYFLLTPVVYFLLSKRKDIILPIMLIGGGVLAFIVMSVDVASLLSFRSYSTNDRFDLYDAALQLISGQEPFFGTGYKPKGVDGLEYAVGSHSMLLSYLVRGGLIGLGLAALAFWLTPTLRIGMAAFSSSRETRTYVSFLLRGYGVIALWTVFQEIDTSILTFTAIAAFIVATGILLGPDDGRSDVAASQ